MATDTVVNQLIINKMSQEKYNEELAAGGIKDNEIYMIEGDESAQMPEFTEADNGKLIWIDDAALSVVSMDSTPTSNSNRPVTSGGVYTAIDSVADIASNAKSTIDAHITASNPHGITPENIGAATSEELSALSTRIEEVNQDAQSSMEGLVPKSTMVNGHELDTDITLSADDIGVGEAMLLKSVSTTMPISGNWTSVAYGNGMFVAVSSHSDQAAYSTDGTNWTGTTMPVSAAWCSVTYGGDKFVAIIDGSADGAYSVDGINWVEISMPIGLNSRSITYGNDKFVVPIYGSDVVGYSADGINWSTTTMPISGNWTSVAYGNGMFVTISYYSDQAAYSTDGINWTGTTIPAYESWCSVTYGGDKFVAVGYNSKSMLYSLDGINWVESFLPYSGGWESVAYGNGIFVAVKNGSSLNDAACSTDGINWTATTLSTSEWTSVAYGNGKFVAVATNSDQVAYSVDGVEWKSTANIITAPDGTDITAYVKALIDTDTVIDVSGKQDKITGTAGQFVVIGDDDNVVAQDAVHPDWDQNDETQPDYVKNRTHYANDTDFSYSGPYTWTASSYTVSGETMASMADLGIFSFDKAPSVYTIGSFYGASYENVEIGKVIKSTSGPSFSFCLTANYNGTGYSLQLYCSSSSGLSGTPTISNVKCITKLNEGYIPDTIARVSDLQGLTAEDIGYDGAIQGTVVSTVNDAIGETLSFVSSVEIKANNAINTANAAMPKTGGTFTGTVSAMSSGSFQLPGTSCFRNSKLVATDTDPTVNGEINWTYG